MATATLVAPKPRDPFAAILLPRHDRVRLLAHYEYAEPHVDPRDLRTWRYESVYQLATRGEALDRKSTRLNSSHVKISYAVFCHRAAAAKRPVLARHLANASARVASWDTDS